MWLEGYGFPARSIEPRFVHGRVFISAVPLVGPRTNGSPPAFAMKLRHRASSPPSGAGPRPPSRPWRSGRGWPRPRTGSTSSSAEWEAAQRGPRRRRPGGPRRRRPRRRTSPTLAGWPARATAPTSACTAATSSPPACSSSGRSAGASTRSRWPACSPAARRPPGASSELPRLVPGHRLRPRRPDRGRAARPDPAPAGRRQGHRRPRASRRPCAPGCPPATATEWDRLLADARATYGVRDSNGLLTAAWPMGLLRRAMLEAGRRLAARASCSTRATPSS